VGGYPFDTVLTFTGVVAGQDNWLELDMPASEGTLTKLIVSQLTGTKAGFTVDLYNSAAAEDAAAKEPYRVLPRLTAAAPAEAVASFGAWAFANQDSGTMGRRYRLLVNIRPASGGTGNYAVSLAGLHPSTA
jgi:hypothetical protein